MNETIQKIMLFINEHTLLLIGICVFLILVLIGYLIDNSVKSKRIRKDIKNADQVPENIKDEIIKQAEEKTVKKEESVEPVSIEEPKLELSNVKPDEELSNININSENVVDPNKQDNGIINFDINQNNEVQPDNNSSDINASLDLDQSINSTNQDSFKDVLNLDIDQNVKNDQINDPDYNIMMNNTEKTYSNDKKLSDILSNINNSNTNTNENINTTVEPTTSTVESDIFGADVNNIVVNKDVNKNDIPIEDNNNSDELDRIMRKLSSMNNQVQDDNYTNIF